MKQEDLIKQIEETKTEEKHYLKNIKISKNESIFLIDTLKAIMEQKTKIGRKHYRTTLYRSDLKSLIKRLQEVMNKEQELKEICKEHNLYINNTCAECLYEAEQK